MSYLKNNKNQNTQLSNIIKKLSITIIYSLIILCYVIIKVMALNIYKVTIDK